MSHHRLEDLRSARFATARRGGYDTEAVDTYLFELADWLETDEAKAALAQHEIERVGERTGSILSAAQASAEGITSEATAEADRVRSEAEAEAKAHREAADSYAAETRESADADARRIREEAEAEAERSRREADEHARLTIREADDRLERAAREAAERTAGVEDEIAALAAKRDEVLENLKAIGADLGSVIEGPGAAKLEIPERRSTAAAFTDEPVAHPEVADSPPVDSSEDPGSLAEDPVTVVRPASDVVFDEDDDDPGEVVRDGEPTRPYNLELDTDEELYEDERPPDPVPSGRDPARRRARIDEPTTDERGISDLP